MKPFACLAAILLAAPLLSAQGARLGVSLQPAEGGAAIVEVEEGSAAAFAGLRPGDRIVGFGDREVRNLDALVEAVRNHRPGDVVRIRYYRGGEAHRGLVVLGRSDGSGPGEAAFLGVMLQAPEEGPGVAVARVLPDSPARVLGLREGDVLLAVDGQPVRDLEALGAALGGLLAGDPVSLTVRRQGEVVRLRGILGRRPANLEEMAEEGGAREAGEAREHREAPEGRHEEARGQEGPWHPNLEAALAAARRSGKPVLVDFSATWCGPCQALAREVLHNQEHAGLLARFEAVQVDVDEKPELAREYGVQGIPDVRILDAEGREIHRFQGFSGEESAVAELEKALEKAAGGAGQVRRDEAAEREAREAEIRARRAHIEARIRELQKEIEELRRELEELRRLQP